MRLLLWITCGLFLPCGLLAQENNIYLNPDNAIGAKASHFFSGVELIQLETTKESYFTNMTGFLVTPDYYIVLDDGNNRVLLFDKKGKFRHKYTRKRYKIQSIQYVSSKDAVFITSRNKNYTIPPARTQQMIAQAGAQADFSKYVGLDMLYLGSDPAFKTQSLPVPRFALHGLFYFNGHYLTTNTRYNKYLKDSISHHLLITENNQIVGTYFPFLNIEKLPTYYSDMNISMDPAEADNAVFLQKEYDNTVYLLTPDSLQTAFRFIFPATHTMPGDFQTTMFKDNIAYTNYVKQNGKAISAFYNMISMKPLFFFTARDNNHQSKSYLFNQQNNMLYDRSKINADSTVYFLPNKIFSSIMEADSQYLYATISNPDLLKEKTNILDKNEILPQEVGALLDGLHKFNNPIVVKLKVNTASL